MSERLLSTLSLPLPTLSALAGAGYETISDLSNSTPEQLSKDLNLPLPASQVIFSATRPSVIGSAIPTTQSAAAMMGSSKRYSTRCAPLDRLLGGGLKCGSVLELNGPPGCGKEQIATNAVKTFVDIHQEVLFVDMQNMVPPATIKRILSDGPTAQPDGLDLVHYQTLHTATEFVVFLRNLPAYLDKHPATGLLVLSSLTFPFQAFIGIKDGYKTREAILEKLKQTLAQKCTSMNLSVIITSQLQTKQVPGSGEPGSKERWIMIPTFGNDDFLPGRTNRVIIVPQWKTSGVMRLLYSPKHVRDQPPPPLREEPYQKIEGVIQ